MNHDYILEFKIAQPYKRVIATLIDLVVLIPIIIIAENIISKVFHLKITPIFSFIRGYTIKMDDWADENIWKIVGLYFITKSIIVYFYYAIFEASNWQGTIGKKAMKIIVADLSGEKINLHKASVRVLSKFLSSQLLIGYIMILFTKKKQGLHDIIAKTIVLDQ